MSGIQKCHNSSNSELPLKVVTLYQDSLLRLFLHLLMLLLNGISGHTKDHEQPISTTSFLPSPVENLPNQMIFLQLENITLYLSL